MAQDPREQEIQRQFLDEAQEYLGALEGAVLGLAGSRIDLQKINEAMRASHSIKGGAAMMGYQTLSEFAHRLEDSFKVLKTKRQSLEISFALENQLLAGVDCLQRVIQMARQDQQPDETWLTQEAHPLFDQLRTELGDADEETAASVLGGDDGGQALLDIVFSSEVEGVLQQLEGLLNQQTPETELRSELITLAGELGGLGEMLQLSAFSQLCEAVIEALDHHGAGLVAEAALNAWRRAQALVLAQQLDLISTELVLPTAGNTVRPPTALPQSSVESLEPSPTPASQAAVQPHSAPEFQSEFVAEPTRLKPTDLEPLPSEADVGAAAHRSANAPSHEAEDADRTVRVSLKRIDQLNDLFGELTIERNALALYCDRLRSLTQLLKQRVQVLDQSNRSLRSSYDEIAVGMKQPAMVGASNVFPSRHGLGNGSGNGSGFGHPSLDHLEFDRLEMDRYDTLSLQSQSVMETIVQVQEVTTDVDLSLEEADITLRNLNKTTKHLSNQLTHLRMRPLSDVLNRFPRALRELSQEHGKRVQLKLEGSETLVDRNVLEALQEPLMHLLRNAFDHGLESPDDRQAVGKPAEGNITIRARQRGNRTLIEFQDDGRGINLDKVRAKATNLGLDEALLAEASQQELLSLIFEPGFSTSDRVTNLSGRGVGMDVVRERLKPVRGEISVDTQPGQGTLFTLAVPFSLAVLRVLVVECKGMLLAIPAEGVAEVILIEQLPEHQQDSACFTWNGQSLERIELSPWLRFNCPRPPYSLEADPKIETPALLVVNVERPRNRPSPSDNHDPFNNDPLNNAPLNNELVGLEIERSWGEQEVAVRRIEGQIGMPAGFSNCTIMGDGRVIPLVSVPELLVLLAHADLADADSTLETPGDRPAPLSVRKPAILVVDDSINVRRFLALTLEKAGYRVEQAKDGQQALELLAGDISVQAIICDIEMPRLDGYGVLAHVKADPAIAHLPVAMLTSRSGDKHRNLAMNLGASAYFSKPYNEQELLAELEAMMVTT